MEKLVWNQISAVLRAAFMEAAYSYGLSEGRYSRHLGAKSKEDFHKMLAEMDLSESGEETLRDMNACGVKHGLELRKGGN